MALVIRFSEVSLVGVLSLCEHIGLQLREVSRLVTTLADPHVQQVGVYGCVVGLQQSALSCLGCRDKHRLDSSWLSAAKFVLLQGETRQIRNIM